MTDIFLSYAREDQEIARQLAEALRSRGWSVWWDPDIHGGKRFDDAIEAALESARCVIVLWSAASVASPWVRNEASDGLGREVLLPARLDAAKIPLEFRRLQTADLSDWRGQTSHREFDRLCRDAGQMIGREGTPPAVVVQSGNIEGQKTSPAPNESSTSRHLPLWPIRVLRSRASTLLVVALLGLGIYAWNPARFFGEPVSMPDINGLTLQQAMAVLSNAGLSGNAVSGAEARDPRDLVVESTIKPGTKIRRGTTVDLRPLKATIEDTTKERDHFDYISAYDKRRLRWRKTGAGTWAEAIDGGSQFPPIAFTRTGRTEVEGNVGTVVRAGDRELDVFIPDIGAHGNQPDSLRQRHGGTNWQWLILGQIVDPK